MPSFTIRRAVVGDIDEFKDVVVKSVLELCKDYYSPEQLNSLLAQYPNRDIYQRWIHERVLVVAEHDGRIVGFAQYHPPDASIEAVHVLPRFGGQGIGKMLVQEIEAVAREQGAARITLGSSLNATDFYEKCGYGRKDSCMFRCNDGVELKVVNFEKSLRGQEPEFKGK